MEVIWGGVDEGEGKSPCRGLDERECERDHGLAEDQEGAHATGTKARQRKFMARAAENYGRLGN